LEKERQQQLERERLEKEQQTKKERKEKEKLEQERKDKEYKKNRIIEIEKPNIGFGSRFKTYKTDRSFNNLNISSPTEKNINSFNKFRISIEDNKKPYKQVEEEKEKKGEDFINPVIKRKLFRSTAHSPVPQQLREEEDKVEHINKEPKSLISIKKNYKKNKIPEDEFKSEKERLDELKEDNGKDESIKNIFKRKKQQIIEEVQKQTNEEAKPRAYKKNRFGKNLAEEEEDEKQSVNEENQQISLYGKKSHKFNKSPSEAHLTSYDNNNIRNNLSINQGVGFDYNNGTITVGNNRGKSTKIKIYKCVIWKNTNPNIDENTIKNIIRRSGSQILNNGGFVINLSRHNSLSNNIFEYK